MKYRIAYSKYAFRGPGFYASLRKERKDEEGRRKPNSWEGPFRTIAEAMKVYSNV